MRRHLPPFCSWFGSDRPGFALGTSLVVALILLVRAAGIQASLSAGPGGDFPRLTDVFLYALSHDDLPSLLVSLALLLTFGPCQERRWGTAAFLALSGLTVTALPLAYALLLFVFGGEASRFCGYSAVQLALFTAQCRQVTPRRLLRCLPVWSLPWFFLLLCLLLLPGTPALLHFCAICIGHNYGQSFIGMLQELEEACAFKFIPNSFYVSTSARFRLPTHGASQRSRPPSQMMPSGQAAPPPVRESSSVNHHLWVEPVPFWTRQEPAAPSDAEVLDEQLLRAGILASLQDAPEGAAAAKVEVSKSSVSSLRLQQLERMGFPTEKAVVALAASKQLDGAISLLIDDSIGEEAVVVAAAKGRSPVPPRSTEGASHSSSPEA